MVNKGRYSRDHCSGAGCGTGPVSGGTCVQAWPVDDALTVVCEGAVRVPLSAHAIATSRVSQSVRRAPVMKERRARLMGETHETASLHVTGVLAHLMRGAVAIARVDLVMRTARTTARTHERLLVPSGPTASRCRVGAAGLLPALTPNRIYSHTSIYTCMCPESAR